MTPINMQKLHANSTNVCSYAMVIIYILVHALEYATQEHIDEKIKQFEWQKQILKTQKYSPDIF